MIAQCTQMRVTAAESRHWPLPCQSDSPASQGSPRNHARSHMPQTRGSVAVILQQQEEQHCRERHCGVAMSLARSSSRTLCISTVHDIMIMSQGVWHTQLSHDRAESAQPKKSVVYVNCPQCTCLYAQITCICRQWIPC